MLVFNHTIHDFWQNRSNRTYTLTDLTDLVPADYQLHSLQTTPTPTTTRLEQQNQTDTNSPLTRTNNHTTDEWWEYQVSLRRPVVDQLNKAGLKVDASVLQVLPTWKEVSDLYGSQPVIIGQQTCQAFRDAVPADRRYAGVAGQMNAGTTALAKYLNDNLIIPANHLEGRGILWTVPWYKHSWLGLRNLYKYKLPDQHETVLPIVIVRDPYFWMRSMCQSPYTMEWNQTTHCPNLVKEPEQLEQQQRNQIPNPSIPSGQMRAEWGVPVRVLWGKFHVRWWNSLAHVWSEWYNEYLHADFPRLIIRFEDLLYHTETVLEAIRECVGANYTTELSPPLSSSNKKKTNGTAASQQKKHGHRIIYAAAPAKTHPYFTAYKAQTGLLSAMIKYGHDRKGQRMANMTAADRQYARQFLDPELMKVLGYTSPTSKDDDNDNNNEPSSARTDGLSGQA